MTDKKTRKNCRRRDVTAARASYILNKIHLFDMNTPFRHVSLHGSHLSGGRERVTCGALMRARDTALIMYCARVVPLTMNRQAIAATTAATSRACVKRALTGSTGAIPVQSSDSSYSSTAHCAFCFSSLVFVWRHVTLQQQLFTQLQIKPTNN